jgi:hypothetical protein
VTLTGDVRAVGATINGPLSMRNANLTKEGRIALALDSAEIKGGAFLKSVTVTGEVRAIGAMIGGQFNGEDANAVDITR